MVATAVPPPTSAQFSLTVRVRIDHRPGMLGRVATAIGEAGGTIGDVELIAVDEGRMVRDITIDAGDEAHEHGIVEAVRGVEGAEVVDWTDRTLGMHVGGKLEVRSKYALRSADDLSRAYTPGVARVCSAIAADPDKAFQYTVKRNTVAVVSDGTAVLGLGDIGPRAAMPVMEGKAMLFKEFAGVDAFPLCLSTKDPDAIVATVEAVAPGFGGINLEDISAPRCFEVERRLQESLDIPVFHDDQHGTAVVTLAALLNACRLTGRDISTVRALIIGVGAAGVAVAKILRAAGVRDIVGCDSRGALHPGREDYAALSPEKRWLADETNADGRTGGPADVIEGMDLLVGLSGARALAPEALAGMAPDAMVFAMANPTPEVSPEEAAPYARVIATGRSDYPNQINNVLCFPGIFRGALDVRARAITEPMKMAAARGIAAIVGDDELRETYVIPSPFNRDVAPAVADAVAAEARTTGEAQSRPAEFGYAVGDTTDFLAIRP
jgi:malate dehydrogenase (oxaloacetate-decarboxylating)